MDQLREILATVRTYLGQMSASNKLLIASLAVILVMTLAFVSLYAARPSRVALLSGYPAEDQQRAAAFLRASGIDNEIRADGKLYVSPDAEAAARALLAENGKLPADKTILFNNLLEKQSWINSRQQNEQIFLIALQNQLAADISNFRGIKSATVILDVPDTQGMGHSVRKPSASATVTTRSGQALSQGMVDAIAGYIAGSRSGLDLDRVRVIDASTGQQRKPSSEADAVPTTYLEHAAKVEALAQEKISGLLSYIPGVIVAVTAQVDVTRVNSQTTQALPRGKGTESVVKSSTEDTVSSSQATKAADPGLRSNVEAAVSSQPAGPANTSNTNKTQTDFEIIRGTKTETVIDPKGMTTMVGVSVNIPRGFVAKLLEAGSAAPAAGAAAPAQTPDDKAVQEKFDKDVRPQIEALIKPHVRVMTAQANKKMDDKELDDIVRQSVSIAMMPIDLPPLAPAKTAGILGGLTGTGGMLSLGGGLLDKVVVGVLGAVALGFMFTMVRKAGKKVEMPTAEELVGLPPQLATASDLVGEADEGDAALAGIEVDENQVQSQKVLEQVGELVDQKPDAAAKLLNRWVTTVTE